jgi:signal transduction histidine kinase
MNVKNSLRGRLAAACVLLATIIGAVFALAGYIIIESIEHQLIEERLTRAAQLMIQNRRAGVSIPATTQLTFAVGDEIPAEMRTLRPGVHQVEAEGKVFEVLIAEENGERYAVIDDISAFEQLELVAAIGLGGVFLAGVLLALAIARTSANRIIAPLTALAEAVQQENLAGQRQLADAPDEVGFLARVLQNREAQLAEVLRRERLFTADVSHELRTPLTVALGAAEILSTRLAERPDLHVIAERIRRTTDEMSARVSALLQLARAPDKVQTGALPMRPVLRAEIERCKPLLDGKAVTLSFDAPAEVWVDADADLVAIAVGNLLRNACESTQRGTVRVALAANSVIVEDTGPGIPEGLRARLFEPFVRGDSPSASGSGLGLSIVKRVAERLGWLVSLEDRPQGGSRFTLAFQDSSAD